MSNSSKKIIKKAPPESVAVEFRSMQFEMLSFEFELDTI